jgi:hypothetical protein
MLKLLLVVASAIAVLGALNDPYVVQNSTYSVLTVYGMDGCNATQEDDDCLTFAQVTPFGTCKKHRNGPIVAIHALNSWYGNPDNPFGIGKSLKQFKFRLYSVTINETVPGVTSTTALYTPFHVAEVRGLVQDPSVVYLVGSCSFAAGADKIGIKKADSGTNTALLAQVGPNSYYDPPQEQIFGVHVSSYTYAEPFTKLSKFAGAKTAAIAGRDKTEFYITTCQYAKQYCDTYGINATYYNIYAEAMKDNPLYQAELAQNISDLKPDLVFGCVGDPEWAVWWEVFKYNEFVPQGLFFTNQGWGWATNVKGVTYEYGTNVTNASAVLNNAINKTNDMYGMVGAGQWQEEMTYDDDLVGNYTNFVTLYKSLTDNDSPTYDSVASFTVVEVVVKAFQWVWTTTDIQDNEYIKNDTNYDYFLSQYPLLKIPNGLLFGYFEFDKYHRNAGRGPANFQFQHVGDDLDSMWSFLISPLDKSSHGLEYPTIGSQACSDGYTVDDEQTYCFACDKCVACDNHYHKEVQPCDSNNHHKVVYFWDEPDARRCGDAVLPTSTTIDCNWVERTSSVGIVFQALCAFVMFLAILFGCLVLKYWSFAPVKHAQPELLFMVLVGSLLMMVVPFLNLDEPTDGTCIASRVCFIFGYTVAIGALTVKIMRVWLIFENKRLESRSIDKVWAAKRYGFICLCGGGFCILWGCIDPPMKRTQHVFNSDLNDYVDEVSCGSDTTIFLTIAILLYAVLGVSATYLAYVTRNVSKVFAETFWIMTGMFALCFISVVFIPVSLISSAGLMVYTISSAGMVIVTATVICALFVPKFIAVHKLIRDPDAFKGEESASAPGADFEIQALKRKIADLESKLNGGSDIPKYVNAPEAGDPTSKTVAAM